MLKKINLINIDYKAFLVDQTQTLKMKMYKETDIEFTRYA